MIEPVVDALPVYGLLATLAGVVMRMMWLLIQQNREGRANAREELRDCRDERKLLKQERDDALRQLYDCERERIRDRRGNPGNNGP